ncbi:hypothetical protein [Mesorhizobium captivum]|uniref:hypothetical protein n=1 Tax=Mesorhizobium captivum TaxID=3072319 RepID=UPI002A24C6B6|nr:hypothetical protein [Mesorhizobium sp. VK3C]MDX8447814.1 hypothetical protein [Mesorhizobium sp. VK3C]
MRIPHILNPFAISGAEIVNARQRSELLRELLNPIPQVMAFAGIAFAALVGALDGNVVWQLTVRMCSFRRIMARYLRFFGTIFGL